MKIGLVSSAVPLVDGGGRFIVTGLASQLIKAGHEVETIWIPSSEDPSSLFSQMTAFRLLDLEHSFDRVVTFRPPSHVVRHSNKIVWFIHHIRVFYDLWETDYRPVPDSAYWRAFRRSLMDADTNALLEARQVFTNSKTVGNRIRSFNGLESEVLYPPVLSSERFQQKNYGDVIVCICRCEHHKRQHLLVEAMRYTKTPVRLHLAGASTNPRYAEELRDTIARHSLAEKVTLDDRWISEEEKEELIATALAAAYVPFDEDSYGYPTIEAAHAGKATISASDAGGVSEFVIHRQNGMIAEPDPRALAEIFDELWSDRQLAGELGAAARQRVVDLGITWDHVLSRMLS